MDSNFDESEYNDIIPLDVDRFGVGAVMVHSSPSMIMRQECPFKFLLSDLQKHTSEKPLELGFWVYTIHVEVNLEEYKTPRFDVSRRYNEFAWLRERLVEDHPACIVPPIPEKTLLGSVEKIFGGNKSLMNYRKRALQLFLDHVGHHPVLRTSPHLYNFLTSSDQEFAAIKATKIKRRESALSNSLSLGQKFKALVKPKVENTELENYKKYISTLESALESLHTKLSAMLMKKKEMGAVVGDFSAAATTLAEAEAGYYASSYDNSDSNEPIQRAFAETGGKLQSVVGTLTLEDENENTHQSRILYFLGSCDAIKSCIKYIEHLQYTDQSILETLNSKKEHRAKLSALPESDPKILKLESEISDLTTKKKDAENYYQTSLDTFHRDMRVFMLQKSQELRDVLVSFVTTQMDLTKMLTNSLESLKSSLELC